LAVFRGVQSPSWAGSQEPSIRRRWIVAGEFGRSIPRSPLCFAFVGERARNTSLLCIRNPPPLIADIVPYRDRRGYRPWDNSGTCAVQKLARIEENSG
jgi:hypothetical protein